MEFQEVRRLVSHGNVSSATLRDLNFRDRSADSLEVSLYQSHFPYLPLSASPKRRQQIASRLVNSVRRLGRSTVKKQGSFTSDDENILSTMRNGKAGKRRKTHDDNNMDLAKRWPRQRKLLSQIKDHHSTTNSNYTSGVEDNMAAGYVSMDEAYMHNRRRHHQRKHNLIRKLQNKSKSTRLFSKNRIERELSLSRKESITLSPLDLHQIHDQMQTFSVPETWAHFDEDRSFCSTQWKASDAPISSKEVVQHLCSDVRQLQSLVDCEGNKIATCKEEIEEYILKLQKLDQDVQLLNSRITQVRQESRERMKQILQETEERKPRMEKAQSRHKRLVTSIANHKRGTSYLIRLTELDRRVKAAKRRQDIWDSIQGWIPTVAILISTILISLLISFCRNY